MRSEKWGRIILRSLKGQLQDERSLADMDRVADRFAHSKAWDQADFNDELFFLSHPGFTRLHASRRTMDFSLYEW